MFPTKSLLIILICLTIGIEGQSQSIPETSSVKLTTADYIYEPSFTCCNSFVPRKGFNLYGLYSFGESPGICNNYGSTGVFFAPCLSPCSLGTVLDVAYHFFENDDYGVSGGVGVRVSPENPYYTAGIHVFYDYLKSDIADSHQISFAVEILANCFELRANGYFPLSDKVKKSTPIIFNDYDNTGVTTPYLVTLIKEEFTLQGFDVEAGLNYCCNGLSSYIGAGAYYFSNRRITDFWGAKGKIRVEYGKLLNLEGQVTWDDQNHTEGRGVIELKIPFYIFESLCCPCKSEKRIYRDAPIHTLNCFQYTTNY